MVLILGVLSILGLNEGVLDKCSYESNLDCSLSRELRKADINSIKNDLDNYFIYLLTTDLDMGCLDYRIKSKDSINRKLDKYANSTRKIKSVVNDIVGIRGICSSYDFLFKEDNPNFRIVDLSKGKSNDDGYRGVHIYYQKNSKCYPIEIQFSTFFDRQFNDWLHKYSYKYLDNSVGISLRKEYECGGIKSEKEFLEVLDNVLSDSKRF